VKYLKTGSALLRASAAAVEMPKPFSRTRRRYFLRAFLQGEYGIDGYYMGVLCNWRGRPGTDRRDQAQ